MSKKIMPIILVLLLVGVLGLLACEKSVNNEKKAEEGKLNSVEIGTENDGELPDASDNGYMTEEQEKALPINNTAWKNGDTILVFTSEGRYAAKENGSWKYAVWYAADGMMQINAYDGTPEIMPKDIMGEYEYHFDSGKLCFANKTWEQVDYKSNFKEAKKAIEKHGQEFV